LFFEKNIEFHSRLNSFVLYPPPEKVIRPDGQAVPIPTWLGNIIVYFKKWVRKGLQPHKAVRALWLNSLGKPLEPDAYTLWIASYVNTKFDDKRITPITFRRMIATYLFEKELSEHGGTVDELAAKFCLLINTSPKVSHNFKIF
jgi:hypothetical protein